MDDGARFGGGGTIGGTGGPVVMAAGLYPKLAVFGGSGGFTVGLSTGRGGANFSSGMAPKALATLAASLDTGAGGSGGRATTAGFLGGCAGLLGTDGGGGGDDFST
eukprot:TRINITY_DN7248_c0_g1_i1.p3 TRINITY_DN7248_c0_g1~~TRINITY_DN7248_c0_g1_i1.p3  ORF type:complete len:106 (-),score=4.67 TRINITY_DN7248_c0_g1_i1:255-572(-)